MNARCLHCGTVIVLDLSKTHVLPYRTPLAVVHSWKADDVLNGDVIRGPLCPCKLSVDYEVVAQKK